MRLIDADNAIHALGVFSDMEHGNKHFLNGINSAKEIINECVTIDAVPVVRCKDCKHFRAQIIIDGVSSCYVCCRTNGYSPGKNHYCAWGEKSKLPKRHRLTAGCLAYYSGTDAKETKP